MTDEELDRARADEALRQNKDPVIVMNVARAAARLAREGWEPPDPLWKEVDSILDRYGFDWRDRGKAREPMWIAMRRGIEIGKGQP